MPGGLGSNAGRGWGSRVWAEGGNLSIQVSAVFISCGSVTKDQTRGLEQQKCLSLCSGARQCEIRVSVGEAPSGGSEGTHLVPPSRALAFRILGLYEHHPFSASIFTWPSSL